MRRSKELSANQARWLGLDQRITRRDFLNATVLGTGAILLELPAPAHLLAQMGTWEGYGGVGDYAKSHGNTEEVMRVGHDLRDGRYDRLPADVVDIDEEFDVAVIGGGLSGLGAAFYFKKAARPGQKCLLIENHPIFGGEAKRNEFIVDGQRLIGPQGSNDFGVPTDPATFEYEIYTELGVPREFQYQAWDSKFKPLQFSKDNYGFQLWADLSPSFGYFFDEKSYGVKSKWMNDIWGRNLEGAPFSASVKQDFLTWRYSKKKYYDGLDFERWLDTMTYKDYIEKVMGLSPEVTKYADPILAAAIGLGCDAISAYAAYQIDLPGVSVYSNSVLLTNFIFHSFPGGNDGFSRHLVKKLVPGAIQGSDTFEDILNARVNFDALDRPGNDIQLRLGATAVRVEHDGPPEKSERVWITYVKSGKAYRAKARGVVMAGGSWMSRSVVRDLPEEYRSAFQNVYRSPMLVVNVAVTNWRFLYKLGLTACRWFDGFGFCCNIRQPMIVGDYRPPLDPDQPTVVTFYVPFYYPGRPIQEQGTLGRKELLSTSYSDYERQIREQMVRLFGGAGFNPRTDIAGIILNRWGHAYVDPQPGFYFGRDGKPAPREVIRKRFGRIAFAHSELNGHQNWVVAIEEGRRATNQVMDIL